MPTASKKKERNYMEYKTIRIVDKQYPEKLKKIYAPPEQLHIMGNENILNQKSIAIIGCRECSTYGANLARKFSYELSKIGINIIFFAISSRKYKSALFFAFNMFTFIYINGIGIAEKDNICK